MTTIYFSKVDSDELDTDEKPFNPFSKHNITLFGKPREIGHFSVDVNKKVIFNRSKMRYLLSNLSNDNLHYNLNADYSAHSIDQYVTLNKLHYLLFWIVNKELELDVDFITVRGTLTRIMCTPYSAEFYKNEWEICATKFNGVIYLSAVDTEDDLSKSSSSFPRLQQFQSWGYKFEQYLTTKEIDGEPDLKLSNNCEEFCIVVRNKLNNFTLLYQAEIDAVLPDVVSKPGTGDTSCYIELKVSKILSRTSDLFKFRSKKLVHWWAQSYLCGISEIICGRRTDEGVVKFLEFYKVNNIPETAYGLWSSEACLNFCNKFLELLKKIVVEDDSNIVYKFAYKGEGIIYCSKLINPEDKYKIIPRWYITSINESRKLQ